jgi:enoyl-CoA hydratase/carnithine racemase
VTYEEIDYRVQSGVATITLDRPEKLNALTARMAMELLDVFDRIDEDDAVRAVIVTGRGRAFCAGADLSLGAQTFDYDSHHTAPAPLRPLRGSGESDPAAALRSAASTPAEERRDGGGMITLRIFDLKKPIIAAINGSAVGVGITMTLAMDIRLAADDARMGFVFARRGIVPEACSSWFLPRLVGIDQALEWSYRGDVFPATEALAGGLVRSLHAGDELLPAARELADGIVANTSAVSIALTRQLMWRMLGAAHPMEAHRADSRAVNATGRSADALEGVTSFLEKRPPTFTGTVTDDLPDVFPDWEPPEFS